MEVCSDIFFISLASNSGKMQDPTTVQERSNFWLWVGPLSRIAESSSLTKPQVPLTQKQTPKCKGPYGLNLHHLLWFALHTDWILSVSHSGAFLRLDKWLTPYIAHYDRILVMDDGHLAEFDTALNLYDKPESIFRSLCVEANLTRDDVLKIRAEHSADWTIFGHSIPTISYTAPGLWDAGLPHE